VLRMVAAITLVCFRRLYLAPGIEYGRRFHGQSPKAATRAIIRSLLRLLRGSRRPEPRADLSGVIKAVLKSSPGSMSRSSKAGGASRSCRWPSARRFVQTTKGLKCRRTYQTRR
jgi:hypothetical protein